MISHLVDGLQRSATSPFRSAAVEAESHDRRWLQLALVIAISTTVFEGPLRYLLNLAHLDLLIFARDAALFGSLLAFVFARVAAGETPVAVAVFAFLAAFHSVVALINLQVVVAPIYGLKMFVPALCGYLASQVVFRPGPRLLRWIGFLWILSVAGAAIDQFTTDDLPWVGMTVEIGGIDVFLARDWQAGGVIKRVGGITRSSINLAVVLPLLSFMLLGSVKRSLLRVGIAAITLMVLYWTTQKGSILGFAIAVLALSASRRQDQLPLKVAAVLTTTFMIAAPTLLIHYHMPIDRGVFSFESLIERVQSMWPSAWAWMDRFPNLLGVGLGGISGAQRFYAPTMINYADNLFVYLYANFGIVAPIYVAAALFVVVGARARDVQRDGVALASFVFLVSYGLVVSTVEDQIASLWLGASLGWLAQLRPQRSPEPLRSRHDEPAIAEREVG